MQVFKQLGGSLEFEKDALSTPKLRIKKNHLRPLGQRFSAWAHYQNKKSESSLRVVLRFIGGFIDTT